MADNLTFTSSGIVQQPRVAAAVWRPRPLFLGAMPTARPTASPSRCRRRNPYNPFGMDLVGTSPASTGCARRRARHTAADLLCGTTCDDWPCSAVVRWNPATRVQPERGDYQFRGGFKGYFNMLGNEWDWDAGYTYGRNNESDSTNGLVNTERLQKALGSARRRWRLRHQNCSCTIDGQASGCVPFNIFGGTAGHWRWHHHPRHAELHAVRSTRHHCRK